MTSQAASPIGSAPVEWWHFDFAASGGRGGFTRLVVWRDLGVAWLWGYVISPETGLVVVRDHHVPLPRGTRLLVKADALWSEYTCVAPGEFWELGFECYGVTLDDPLDALDAHGARGATRAAVGEIGERTPVAWDLEWEALVEPPDDDRDGDAAEDERVVGAVRGDLDVGVYRFRFDGWGEHVHGRATEPNPGGSDCDAGGELAAAWWCADGEATAQLAHDVLRRWSRRRGWSRDASGDLAGAGWARGGALIPLVGPGGSGGATLRALLDWDPSVGDGDDTAVARGDGDDPSVGDGDAGGALGADGNGDAHAVGWAEWRLTPAQLGVTRSAASTAFRSRPGPA